MEKANTLVIDQATAEKLYPSAGAEIKAVFEAAFGKKTFLKEPTDIIKTVEDACEVLGINPATVGDKKLETVISALNFVANGNKIWFPDYNNTDEKKWCCWWYMNNPGFCLRGCYYDLTITGVGARLVFLTEVLARYAASQFFDLFRERYVMRPEAEIIQTGVASSAITDFHEINSFEAACSVKGYDPVVVLPDVSAYPARHQKALTGIAKLFIINEAINYVDNGNQDWEPNYDDSDEGKHYPWVDMDVDDNNPSGFRLGNCYCVVTATAVGTRLVFKSEAGSRHAFNRFENLYKDVFKLK